MLAGEVRPAPRGQERLKEAAKLGLSRAVIAQGGEAAAAKGLEVRAIEHLGDLVAMVAAGSR